MINFAGGRGALDGKTVCDATGLRRAFSGYGHNAKLPSLWLYAQNDQYFPPEIAKTFFAAYTQSGGPAELHILPAFSRNGHTIMDSAPESFWWPSVSDFLREHGLPYKKVLDITQARLLPPSVLNQKGMTAFSVYLASMRYEKAFAVSDDGAWGCLIMHEQLKMQLPMP